MINFLMVTFLTLSAITLTFGTPILYAAKSKVEPKKLNSKVLSTLGISKLKDAKIGKLTHKGLISIDDTTIQTAEIHGVIKMEKTNVKKEMKVFGPFKAQNCELGTVTITGPCKIENSKVSSLTVIGPAKVDETTINGSVRITGPFKADEATFKEAVSITGPLKADESKFEGPLTINFENPAFPLKREHPIAIFDETKAEEVLIKGTPKEDKKILLILKDGSKIKKITFESKKGLVITDSDSSVDKLIGGEFKDTAKKKDRRSSRKKKESKKDKKEEA